MDILINIYIGIVGAFGVFMAGFIIVMVIAVSSFVGNEIAVFFGMRDSYCNLTIRDLVLGMIPLSVVIYALYLLGAYITGL